MKDFYIYIAQVNVALLVFYLLYRFLFVRDTFLEIRRLFLFTVVGLAFLYPLVSLSSWLQPEEPLQIMMVNYSEILTGAVAVVAPVQVASWWTWQHILFMVWGGGALVLLLRMLVQLVIVCRMAFAGSMIECQGRKVIALSDNISPFSFFGWIFVNPACHDNRELAEIMAHETTHVRQWHSLDMLLGEVLCLLFWFNPVVWLLRKEIRQNLEFLADQHVVSSGYNRKNYQYHLLRLSHQLTAVQNVNNFNVSSLKKRIIMMNKKQTSKLGLIKYALLVPVTGALILSANAGTVINAAENSLREQKIAESQEMRDDAAKGKLLAGKVLDENGKPLPGVSVIVRNSSIGAMTDARGEFKLKVTAPGVLCFSYVGRGTKTVAYDMSPAQPEIKLVLEKNVQRLETLMVTGMVSESGSKAENKPQKEGEDIFVVVEEMPVFPSGNVYQYLGRQIKYPVIALENGIEGDVLVSFVIDKEGKVTNPKVVEGVDASLDKEALRVVSNLPDWKPGKQRGKPVEVAYTIPVQFRLSRPEPMVKVMTLEADSVKVSKVYVIGSKGATGSIRVQEIISGESFSGDEKPLFILDGIEAPADFKVESLDRDKIKSITVLKSEAAVTLYGQRGRKGVIVIETKD